ncbi:MAG TPA: acetyl-CoA carboxylase biotin carboxyl carrier protein subunit [Candidatus Limnocylindria bacterium]|nr:acetyl-CoA carboxylase biotin carboxyl carrier protein subunit [Candidatus Limnocylindria bacterium]
MSERGLEVSVGGQAVEPRPGCRLEWVDRAHGVARLIEGERARSMIVEGAGGEWVVTLGGRRIPVSVATWRERMLAAAAPRGGAGGSTDIRATLPGLVVALRVGPGQEVTEGESLLTVEAMKMQNEVRAPRAGRVAEVAVDVGQAVSTGALLVRLEEASPTIGGR